MYNSALRRNGGKSTPNILAKNPEKARLSYCKPKPDQEVSVQTGSTHTHTHTQIYIYMYRVSQEECARHREGVLYVKVYRYNPKHLRPKLNGYGDNGQRKVWSSGGSTHCTCQLTNLIYVCPWVWCPMAESQLTLAVQLCSRLIPECAVSHVTSVLAIHVSCIVLGTLRTTMTCVRVFL